MSGDTDAATNDRPHAGSTEDATRLPRIVITAGGEPDAARLAALVVALTPPAAAPPETGPPAWRHAALLEGVGRPAILTPGDLEVADPRSR